MTVPRLPRLPGAGSGRSSRPPSTACAPPTTSSSSRARAARRRSTCATRTSSTCAWRATRAAPVLLVGDIDRGGVFAALVGHVELLDARGAGARGRVRHQQVPRRRRAAADRASTSCASAPACPRWAWCPCCRAGAATRRIRWASSTSGAGDDDRPRASRWCACPSSATSPTWMRWQPRPTCACATSRSPPSSPAAAPWSLPGTKSTVADLAWLRAAGLADAMAAAAAAGTPVIGLCGGYQMLGRRILDPEHVESAAAEVPGLGLLDVETTFAGEKRTVRVQGELAARGGAPGPLGPAGAPLRGYEIHMGRSVLRARGCAAGAACAAPTARSAPTAPWTLAAWCAAATCTACSTTPGCAPRSSTVCALPRAVAAGGGTALTRRRYRPPRRPRAGSSGRRPARVHRGPRHLIGQGRHRPVRAARWAPCFLPPTGLAPPHLGDDGSAYRIIEEES